MNPEFWSFVERNIKEDPSKLRLKFHKNKDLTFDADLAITQIECRRKFGKKLADTLSRYPHWLFPSVLAGEQSTSDALAEYHSSLVADGCRIADLTAGLGIDALHLSYKSHQVTAVDIEAPKYEALRYNVTENQVSNIKPVCADCNEYIRGLQADSLDTIFIDPARRADDGSRVFALSQCQPDVTKMLAYLSRIAKCLIVKMSPMLDITQTLRELPNAERIIAVGTHTECKELIAVVNLRQRPEHTEISAVTINDGQYQKISLTTETVGSVKNDYVPKEGNYLYQPYPAVMKLSPFNILSDRYGVSKIHPNTQLYVSENAVKDYPGQIMKIERILPWASKNIKSIKKLYPQINVATRNFPMSADKLKSKLGVSDGGTKRLIATTLTDGNEVMIICEPETSL